MWPWMKVVKYGSLRPERSPVFSQVVITPISLIWEGTKWKISISFGQNIWLNSNIMLFTVAIPMKRKFTFNLCFINMQRKKTDGIYISLPKEGEKHDLDTEMVNKIVLSLLGNSHLLLNIKSKFLFKHYPLFPFIFICTYLLDCFVWYKVEHSVRIKCFLIWIGISYQISIPFVIFTRKSNS